MNFGQAISNIFCHTFPTRNLTTILCLTIAMLLGSAGESQAGMQGQPANSWVHGSNWYCNDGFKKSGNKCVSIFAGMASQPANSWVHSSNWYCNDGFKKSGNKCVSIFAGKQVESGSTSSTRGGIVLEEDEK